MSTPPSPSSGGVRTGPPRIPGEAGLWILLLGDLGLFAVLFVVHLLERRADRPGSALAAERLDASLGLVNTVVLLTSSLLVAWAVRASRAAQPGTRRLAAPLLLGAAGCGGVFLTIKVGEYADKLQHGLTPGGSEALMSYFVLTGLHAAHVLLGMGLLVAMARASRGAVSSLSADGIALFEGGACFWHVVDALWIVLFPLLYLIG